MNIEDVIKVNKKNKAKEARYFKAEVEALCRKYNLSISHEDGHGAFVITDFDEIYMDWFNQAKYHRD